METQHSRAQAPAYLRIAYILIWVSLGLLVSLTLLNRLDLFEAAQHMLLFKGVRLLLIGSIVVTIWKRHKALSLIGILMMIVVTIQ
ncbi:Uncharacterised protein [Staphylococcus piscifermentans]|uniref:Uncharacterized protein n=1 Tax=Staphylococcus piscifermentans TaxID=70258 RepID=A0A239TI41_9STAP|nr:hypothetical protein [Staphylococcus piscifermentans]RTX85354.1 hypothetical protein CD139_03785 [Staphylococcus piscifermentans]GEP85546.1 hypothetical protein SPI02_21310 [Staphylococcus piscifermentans]SNU96888.1 Uncharacterised protein [Staphylococcus piscifermentans]